MITDKQKEEYLLALASKYYSQGDSYHAFKTKAGNWKFGYTNDYPLQHGNGKSFVLPDKMVEILMNKD